MRGVCVRAYQHLHGESEVIGGSHGERKMSCSLLVRFQYKYLPYCPNSSKLGLPLLEPTSSSLTLKFRAPSIHFGIHENCPRRQPQGALSGAIAASTL
jgi:hypothetical protein